MKALLAIFLVLLTCKVFAQVDSAAAMPAPMLEKIIENELKQKSLRYKLDDKGSEFLEGEFNYMQRKEKGVETNVSAEDEAKYLQHMATLSIVVTTVPEDDEESDTRKNKLRGPTQFDSRIEIAQLDPLESSQLGILKSSRSVGIIIKKANMFKFTDSIYRFNTSQTLGQKYNLCTGEAFAAQPVAGEGTAFLTGVQEVMTAAHVIQEPLDKYVVIFGFQIINKTGAYLPYIKINDVYELASFTYQPKDIDLVKIKLTRPTDRPALVINRKLNLKAKQKIYMLGHPSGLPLKAAVNASITSFDNSGGFYTSLDAFQGNSGSPVFDLDTHQVIGVLVSGATDFVWNGGCNISATCRIPYCKGEKVLQLGVISSL